MSTPCTWPRSIRVSSGNDSQVPGLVRWNRRSTRAFCRVKSSRRMSRGMVASEAMKRTLSPIFVLLATAALAQTPAETPNTDIYYKLAPDAIPQDGVPKGEIKGPFTLPSKAYPGTQHTYWVYVPRWRNNTEHTDHVGH